MTAVEEDGNWSVLRWRVSKNEDKLEKLDVWRGEVNVERASMKEILAQTSKDVTGLQVSFDSLRKTLITFAFTIAGSAIVFALGILAATGRLHA